MTSAPLAARLTDVAGPLFFPVTAYGPDGAVALDAFRAHVRA
ncbi:5-dehydro-4-deoxyglucarate dehydratase, partial [Streptomyces sp. NPDC060209]